MFDGGTEPRRVVGRHAGAPARPRRRLAIALVAAAVLAVSALAIVLRPSALEDRVATSPQGPVQPVQEPADTAQPVDTAVASATTEREVAADAEQVEPAEIVNDAGSAYWRLASQTVTAFSDGVALVSPVSLARDRSEPERPAENSSGWFDGLEREVNPLRDDLNRAIDALLDAVPDDTSSAL
jgi:hypothetical protein